MLSCLPSPRQFVNFMRELFLRMVTISYNCVKKEISLLADYFALIESLYGFALPPYTIPIPSQSLMQSSRAQIFVMFYSRYK